MKPFIMPVSGRSLSVVAVVVVVVKIAAAPC